MTKLVECGGEDVPAGAAPWRTYSAEALNAAIARVILMAHKTDEEREKEAVYVANRVMGYE